MIEPRPADWKAPLRPPSQMMRLDRMGSFHQSRVSFMRALLRRLQSENWVFKIQAFEIDENCVGHAVYSAVGPTHTYSLVAFAHDLDPSKRSDRVIAEAWDCTFTLFDGIPTAQDIERLSQNVPLQEAGRISPTELSLSRANRSVRLWSHVVDALAKGEQPDMQTCLDVGYLMRTTAVYGSGKFGAADRATIMHRPMLQDPFRIELLSVYLTRAFVMDLVEHAAKMKNPSAITLDPHLRRQFGIGNSTGLGMAPFLAYHPALLNNWIMAREEAISLVRSIKSPASKDIKTFQTYVQRAIKNAANWQSAHPLQIEKLKDLRADLDKLAMQPLTGDYPWDGLMQWANDELSHEGQEQLASMLMEPYPELCNDYASCMTADEDASFRIDGSKTVADLKATITNHYDWALDTDYTKQEHCARFWYVSEEKLEPRLGERHEEEGAEYEQPQNFARDVKILHEVLLDESDTTLVADFLLRKPEHRHMVRRAQIVAKFPYAEIQDNLISADMKPLDMLRCKLSFFGANKFDPRSDRWVRICMYQNAPFPHELATAAQDDWAYPSL